MFLGFVISQEGLKVDKEILEWPVPKSTFEVHNFHGLIDSYRKFIKNFSGICAH